MHGPSAGHHHHHHPSGKDLASDPSSRRALKLALVIAAGFCGLEIAGGLIADSLALLSDAAHMLTDCAAYAVALWAASMARRGPTPRRTFGYGRAEILAALLNGASLLAVSAWIVVEAVRRLLDPPDVAGGTVMVIAAAGLIANIAVVAVLARADRHHNLNIRAAFLHAVTDAASSVAVLVSGALVAIADIREADAVVSFLIAGLVVWGSWQLVRDCVDMLMDTAPGHLPADSVAAALLDVDAVTEVHDLHVWNFAPGNPAVSAHVRVASWADRDLVLSELQRLLSEQLHVTHSTLQITGDRAGAPLAVVDRMRVADAMQWAADHIAATRPDLSKSVILAAAGVAAMDHEPDERVSPIALSLRTLRLLRSSNGNAS